MYRYLILLILFILIPGCSPLKLPGPPPDLYNLTPKSTFDEGLPEVRKQLIIEEPVAAGGLDTSRIALRPHATQLQFYADARWTERAPKMVQTLLVESFENTNKIISVGRQSIGLRSDFTLKTELREFQVEQSPDSENMNVRVRINAKLVQQPTRVIIGSQSFEYARETPSDSTMDEIVVAFDIATGKVIKRLVEWTLLNMK
ncbi:MAG: ABC-type transport auxiliary lipoprotein family protein [Desulfocapsaceae bacterium]